ncbi:hypothetical protein D3C84_1254110 [compost metagenome]
MPDEDIELFLNNLASEWVWNEEKTEAHATHTLEDTTFIHPQIRFISVWLGIS